MERALSALHSNQSKSPQKKHSQYSRKSRSQSELKKTLKTKSQATQASTVKLSTAHNNILKTKQKRQKFSDVFLTDGRAKYHQSPAEDLTTLLSLIRPAQVNHQQLDYERLYLPKPKRFENQQNTWVENGVRLSAGSDLAEVQCETAAANTELNNQVEASKQSTNEPVEQAAKKESLNKSSASHRLIQNFKNTMRAVKNMKILLKRHSQDHFDEGLFKTIDEINQRTFRLDSVLRVFDGSRWVYLWFGRVQVHIFVEPMKRLRLEMVMRYSCNGVNRVLSFNLKYTYDVIRVCRRLPHCANDLDAAGLIYHHICGRKEPFNPTIDLYSFKQYLGSNVPNFNWAVRPKRQPAEASYNAVLEEYVVSSLKNCKTRVEFPPALNRECERNSLEINVNLHAVNSQPSTTVIYGQLQTELDQLARPKIVGDFAQEKKLFELHRQFEYAFLRPSSTSLSCRANNRLLMRGTTLVRANLYSNTIEMLLASKTENRWLWECHLLLKLQFALNMDFAMSTSTLMLDERAKQQQTILHNSDPSTRRISEIRLLLNRRLYFTTVLKDRQRKVELVVASANDRSLRYRFEFQRAQLKSTYDLTCRKLLEAAGARDAESQCHRLVGLVEVERTLTYSNLRLPFADSAVFPTRLPGRTVDNKYCLRLPAGVYCLCLELTCSISKCRYIYCYLARSQKNYVRLMEPHESVSQVLESIRQDMCDEIVTKRSLLASITSCNRDGMTRSTCAKKRKPMARREGIRSGSIRHAITFSEHKLKENCAMCYCKVEDKEYMLLGNIFQSVSAGETNPERETFQLEIKIFEKHRTMLFRWTGNLVTTLRNVGVTGRNHSVQAVRMIVGRLQDKLQQEKYRSQEQLTSRLAEFLDKAPACNELRYYSYVGGRLLEIKRNLSDSIVEASLIGSEEALPLKHQQIEDLTTHLRSGLNGRVARRIRSIVAWYQRIDYL